MAAVGDISGKSPDLLARDTLRDVTARASTI
jgi:hypothetical protein